MAGKHNAIVQFNECPSGLASSLCLSQAAHNALLHLTLAIS